MTLSLFARNSLFALLLGAPVAVLANCPAPTIKQLTINAQPVEVGDVHRVSINKLGSMQGARSSHTHFGLVKAKLRSQVAVSAELRTDSSGHSCLYPQLELTIDFEPMPVFIASELPENGCAYNAVLRHELKHVEIYKAHLPRILRQIESDLKPVFSQGFSTRDPKGLHKQIAEDTKKYVSGAVAYEMSIVDKAQTTFDEQDSESTVRGPCAAEFKAAYNNRQ